MYLKGAHPLALALAAALQAALPHSVPASSDELDRAIEQLETAARENDPAEARRLAELALPALVAGAESDRTTCPHLMLLGEAQVRAGRPTEALDTERRAEEMGCDRADRLQLRAWALEFAPDGTRRGEGALLRASEEAWAAAARLLAERAERDPGLIAGALGNAAELALLRGAEQEAHERALAGIRLATTQPQREAIGLSLLRASSVLLGEGTSLDLVGAHVDGAAFDRITDVRLGELKAQIDRDREDPVALAAVAFYALLADSPYEAYNALRYLQEAIALRDDLPDAWYLLGRTHEKRQQLPQAREAYRRQVEKRPQAAATRLAVNALAYLEAELLSSEEAGRDALALLDAEIAKTPREAAFHDTRARLLSALGRKEEACREAALALALPADEALHGSVLRFQRTEGCVIGK